MYQNNTIKKTSCDLSHPENQDGKKNATTYKILLNTTTSCFINLTSSIGKGKVRPITSPEGLEGEQRYHYSFFDLGARCGWSSPRPGSFTPGKDTRYPLHRRLVGSQGLSERGSENLASTGIRSK
jgi:hypothetical protein